MSEEETKPKKIKIAQPDVPKYTLTTFKQILPEWDYDILEAYGDKEEYTMDEANSVINKAKGGK